MTGAERRARIMGLIQQHGRVEVSAVAGLFGAAEMTIRRDLEELVSQGIARRVRGGAVNLLMRGEELPFSMRELESVEEKQRIGRAAADMLHEGESVLLDSGTTTVHVARALAGRRMTVMPLSLHAVPALSAQESVRLVMPGGEARPGELAMAGPLALASIGALRFDTAVLSCCGLADGSVTAHDLGDAAVKKAMRTSAARVILVAESAKFARSAMAVVCRADEVDALVTDRAAPEHAVAAQRDAGVEVVCV